jgi:hypothetical protein
MTRVPNRTTEEIRAGLDEIRRAPADGGTLEMIVRRPEPGAREVVEEAELDVDEGLVGDGWRARGSRHTDDGSAELGRQLTLMNARAVDLFAGGDRDRWALAGDQLFVDLDVSGENLPAGSRLRIGDAVVEVSELPHTGCAKFIERFGKDAGRFANADPEGRALNLRGINARVITGGTLRRGDAVTKL